MDTVRLKTQKLLEKLQPKYGMAPKSPKSPEPPTGPIRLFFKVYTLAELVSWRLGVDNVMYFDKFGIHDCMSGRLLHVC